MLLRLLSSAEIAEWLAFYLVDDADAGGSITPQDDERSIRKKLATQVAAEGTRRR